MGEKIIIPCPKCGAELFDWLEIPDSKVTLFYEIIGDLITHCPICGTDTDIAKITNGYGQLARELFGPPEVSGDLKRFVETVQDALKTLPPVGSGGKLPKLLALELRYGLKDGQRRSYEQVAREVGLTRERVRGIHGRAMVRLRRSTQSKEILESFYQNPEHVNALRDRLSQVESELRESIEVIREQEARFEMAKLVLEQHGLLPKVLPEVPHVLIEELGLGVRSYNALVRAKIRSVAQALIKDPEEILNLRNFGVKSFKELVKAIRAKGIEPEPYWGENLER